MDEIERKRLLRQHRMNAMVGEVVGASLTIGAVWLLLGLVIGAVRGLS